MLLGQQEDEKEEKDPGKKRKKVYKGEVESMQIHYVDQRPEDEEQYRNVEPVEATENMLVIKGETEGFFKIGTRWIRS